MMSEETVRKIEDVIIAWCLTGATEDNAKEAMDKICQYRDEDIIF